MDDLFSRLVGTENVVRYHIMPSCFSNGPPLPVGEEGTGIVDQLESSNSGRWKPGSSVNFIVKLSHSCNEMGDVADDQYFHEPLSDIYVLPFWSSREGSGIPLDSKTLTPLSSIRSVLGVSVARLLSSVSRAIRSPWTRVSITLIFSRVHNLKSWGMCRTCLLFAWNTTSRGRYLFKVFIFPNSSFWREMSFWCQKNRNGKSRLISRLGWGLLLY